MTTCSVPTENGLLHLDNLEQWTRNLYLEERLFGQRAGLVVSKRAKIEAGRVTVVSVSWECPWAKSGGLESIARLLPDALSDWPPSSDAWGHDWAYGFPQFVRLAPYHTKVFDRSVTIAFVRRASVSFDGRDIPVEIFKADSSGTPWYLFKDAAGEFFQADGGRPQGTRPDGQPRRGTDPYFYAAESQQDRDSLRSRLLIDALFAAKAVPVVLAELGLRKNLIIHAHDWTFSGLALTVKEDLANDRGQLESAVVVLTLHNPFDHRVRERDMLTSITDITDRHWPFPFNVAVGLRKALPDTMLECMLGLFDAPIAIVSPGFADDLCGTQPDPLMSFHFAPHLQNPLRYQGAVGIQNANFYDRKHWKVYSIAQRDDVHAILAEKADRRQAMVAQLRTLTSDGDIRVTGHLDPAGDQTTYFHSAGRFDPSQKGFDVLAHAIDAYMEDPGAADIRFIITPVVTGLEPMAFYQQLIGLTSSWPGRVVVVEGRMPIAVLRTIQAGVCWSIWPSLYEPCGGATESLAMGTPVIARRTGGLSRQVEAPNAAFCGLLYREIDPSGVDIGQSWKAVEATDDPYSRLHHRLYRALVTSLKGAIEQGVALRANHAHYAALLARTTEQVNDPFFSPQTFADNYWALYRVAVRRRALG